MTLEGVLSLLLLLAVVLVLEAAHLIAGVLLGLAFACLVIPALLALAGPDREDGRVSEGWRRRNL